MKNLSDLGPMVERTARTALPRMLLQNTGVLYESTWIGSGVRDKISLPV